MGNTAWVKKKLTGIVYVFKNKQMILKSSVKHIFNKRSLLLLLFKKKVSEIDQSEEELCLI